MKIALGQLRRLIREEWFSDWMRTGSGLTPMGGNMVSSAGSSGLPPAGLGGNYKKGETDESHEEEAKERTDESEDE